MCAWSSCGDDFKFSCGLAYGIAGEISAWDIVGIWLVLEEAEGEGMDDRNLFRGTETG